jgi:hypothetical protein
MLFHLPTDPGQEHNVIDEHPAIAGDLHDAFVQFLRQHEAGAETIAYWQGEPGSAQRLADQLADDPVHRAYRSGLRRGLGLNPRSFVRVKEFGEGSP